MTWKSERNYKRSVKYKTLCKSCTAIEAKKNPFNDYPTQLERECPSCGKVLKYTSKCSYRDATKRNSLCNVCCQVKLYDPSDELKRECPKCEKVLEYTTRAGYRYGLKNKSTCYECVEKTDDFREKISKLKKGNTISKKGKRNMRLGAIKRIENTKLNGGQMKPNYNPNSISILEQKSKELEIYDLQHAENGGEFYIKELGYWVDGYSKEKNVVIEYYEKYHDKQTEKDLIRQKEIQDFLNCQFIIIKEITALP